MRNWGRRFLDLFVFVTACLTLAGCSYGGKVNTNLKLESDLSGVRTMQIVVNTEVVAKNFTGDSEEINSLAEKYCPGVFEYDFVSDNAQTTMIFEIPFSSIEEYDSKIKTILPNAETDISVADKAWSDGFSVKENFTSMDLLSWLPTKLVEAGYITAENSRYVLESGANSITFNGTEYPVKDAIEYNNLRKIELKTIDILTDVQDINLYGRTFIFHVDKGSLGGRKKEIKSLFETKVGSTAKVEVNETNTYVNYKIYASKLNKKDVSNLTKILFSGAESEFGDGDDHYYFGSSENLSEEFSVDGYLCTDSQKVEINYYVKTPEGYVVPNVISNSSEEYPGYVLAVRTNGGPETTASTGFIIEKDYNISQVDITTKRLTGNKFKKEFVFVFEKNLTNEEINQVTGKIENVFSNTLTQVDDENSKLKISTEVTSGKNRNGKSYVSVVIKGHMDAVSIKTSVLTGKESTIKQEKIKHFAKIFNDRVIDDIFDLSGVVSHVSNDFKMTYNIDLGASVRIKECNRENAVIDGQRAAFEGKNITGISITAYSWNLAGLFFWIIMLSVAGVSLFFILKGTKKNKK